MIYKVLVFMICVSAYAVAQEIPKEYVSNLTSDSFDERETAYTGLKKWAEKHPQVSSEKLFKLWSETENPELRARCLSLTKEAFLFRKKGNGQGFIGVNIRDSIVVDPDGIQRISVEIIGVTPDKAGAAAGLRVGDKVIVLDDLDFSKIKGAGDIARIIGAGGATLAFIDYVKAKHPDDVVTLEIMRNNQLIKKEVMLIRRDLTLFPQEQEEEERSFKLWFDLQNKQ